MMIERNLKTRNKYKRVLTHISYGDLSNVMFHYEIETYLKETGSITLTEDTQRVFDLEGFMWHFKD